MKELTNDIIDESCNLKNKNELFISTFSNELENSLKEGLIIENEYKTGMRNGYNNVNEMLKSILKDN